VNLKATLITIGKLKDKEFLSIEQEFLKRLNSPLKIIELKNNAQNIEAENKNIQDKIDSLKLKSPFIITLTEHGKNLTSVKLAEQMRTIFEKDYSVVFIIGGSYGFTKDFLGNSQYQLSLSQLTFPHQFARIIFVEQLYRIQCILKNHPYHH
jgi:23S rRNA (pseudouridine1915-N3)-methyltransferase